MSERLKAMEDAIVGVRKLRPLSNPFRANVYFVNFLYCYENAHTSVYSQVTINNRLDYFKANLVEKRLSFVTYVCKYLYNVFV